MRVILLKDVRKVGRKDDVVDVADGYASNYLLKQNLAVAATAERAAALEARRSELQAAQAREDAEADRAVSALAGSRIAIRARATPKGGLFKALGAADIVRAIGETRDIELPADALTLPAPIKMAGEYAIELASKNARGRLTLAVEPAA